jgi:hypothetical protein
MPPNEHDQILKPRTAGSSLLALLVALILTAVCAASASASPVWQFESKELAGSETIVGNAILSKITVPGVTTSCKKMHYEMTISNSAGTGQGELSAFSSKTCFTSSKACTVKSFTAEKLPWATHLVTVAASNYVVVEGIKIAIFYAGEECALAGTLVAVTGSVGGLYDNTSETFTFNAANSTATKATLKALGATIEWQGAFTTEATGAHSGEALTI